MSGSSLEAFVGGLTIAELAERSGKSVEQIVDWALGKRRPSTVQGSTAAAGVQAGKEAGTHGVNTRTPEGREAYDNAVLALLESAKTPMGASKLRKQAGGTPLQMRTALNRLIDTGKVSYTGQARAMVYTLS